MNHPVVIRRGKETDVARVQELIYELAVYERAADECLITSEALLRDGFGEHPLYTLHVAELSGEVVGLALCYMRYSTWKGPVLYLEDLIVKEVHRGQGIGEMLFREVLKETLNRGCFSLHWQVLDWNEPAIRFYQKFNAESSSEWLNMRLTASAISDLH